MRRNYADMPFPGKMDDVQKQVVLARVSSALAEADPPYQMVTEGDTLDERSQQMRGNHGLDFPSLRDGTALFVKSSDMHVAVNFEDTVTLERVFKRDDPDAALDIVQSEANKIFRSHTPAHHESIGFLTASPHLAGSGIQISTIVHLPVLTELRQIPAVKSDVEQHSACSFAALVTAGEKNLAALYEISNAGKGAASAKQSLLAVQMAVDKVVKREKALAEKVLTVPHSALVDQAFRAYGIMRYARRINITEFLALWSRLRMGAENGILDVDLSIIDDLYRELSYVHRPQDHEEAKSLKEINFRRAETIRKRLMEDNNATIR